jgi:hypothetical protein
MLNGGMAGTSINPQQDYRKGTGAILEAGTESCDADDCNNDDHRWTHVYIPEHGWFWASTKYLEVVQPYCRGEDGKLTRVESPEECIYFRTAVESIQ